MLKNLEECDTNELMATSITADNCSGDNGYLEAMRHYSDGDSSWYRTYIENNLGMKRMLVRENPRLAYRLIYNYGDEEMGRLFLEENPSGRSSREAEFLERDLEDGGIPRPKTLKILPGTSHVRFPGPQEIIEEEDPMLASWVELMELTDREK